MKNLTLFLLITIMFSTMSFGQSSYGSNLSATVAIPLGENSKFYKTGYGAIGDFYYEMDSNWRVGLTLGFIRFGVNGTEVNNYFQLSGQSGYVNATGSLSAIPILLSFKYVVPGNSTRFYTILEGGLYTYWTKLKGDITYTGTSAGVVPIDKSEFSSEIGFSIGAGLLFPVNKEISIDANARYNFVRNSGTIKVNYNTGEESVGSSHYLNFGVGVNWNFDL
jgi:outer membrane protein W